MRAIEKIPSRTGLIPLVMALLIMGLPERAVRADGDNTIHVNVGESVTLTVDSVTKMAVADPLVADVIPLSDKEVNVIGKKMGPTTLTIVRGDKPTQVYRVEVGNDAVALLLHKVVNNSSITVRTVGDTVIVDGYVNDEIEAQRVTAVLTAVKGTQVLNLIEVRKPRQIRVRTRVAEVNSEAIKNMGIQWFGPAGQVEYGLQYVGGGSIVHGLIPTSSEFGSVGGAIDPTTVSVTALLNLLVTKNYARLLSEPTLTTLSGKEASFLVGQEIPIVQQLPQSFTVEFKEVGVRMKIKPTVDSQNQINTVIHAEVSQVVGSGALGLPIIGAKTADTALQVKDGQTIVIGGLLENNINRDFLRKFPWLGDIPGLGLFFREKETDKTHREVLFFMTPEIVKDIDGDVATAAESPIMKDWLSRWNAKVLKMPRKGYDWSMADPQGAGFSYPLSDEEKAEKAKKERAEKAKKEQAKNAKAKAAAPADSSKTNAVPAKAGGGN